MKKWTTVVLGLAAVPVFGLGTRTVHFYNGQVRAAMAPADQWQWHSLAVGGGGYVTGMTFDSRDPDRIYLRTDVAGVIKTEDAGRHWRNVNFGLHGLSQGQYGIGAIAVDPKRSNVVYASIGRIWNKPSGIVRSVDYGESWIWLSGETAAYGEGPRKSGGPGMLIDPRDTKRLYIADQSHDNGAGGVWVSTDGGLHWKPTGLTKRLVFTIRFHPQNPDILYAGCMPIEKIKGGMFRSDDRGTTWQPAGLAGKSVYNFQFETGNPKTIYAACGPEGIYKTSNEGKFWRPINTGLPTAAKGDKGNDFGFDSFSYDYVSLDVDPKQPGHVLAAARVIQAFYETRDGGSSWKKIDIKQVDTPRGWMLEPTHFGWASSQIYFGPAGSRTLYVCDFWGAWKSTDAGATWSIHPYGLENACMVTVLPDCETNRRLYLGIWDHDLLIYHDDDRRPFTERVAGTFSYRAPGTNAHISGIVQNTQSPDRLMCTKNSSFLFLSQDRGKKWMRIEKGLPADTKFTLGCPAMADRAGIYFLPINNQGVYRSEDLGQTWTRPANKGLDALNVTGQWSPVQNVLVAAPDAGWLALANNGKLFISTDRAETWKVTATSFTVSRLAADPTEPNVLYAAGNGIFRKTDQGQTWQTLLAQSDPVGLLAVRNRRVLAYTEGKAPDSTIGRLAYKLLLTENEGKTWTNLLNRSMAVWRLQSIAFDPFDAGRVYANSYWAGAWVAQRPATAQTQPATDSAPAK